MYACVHETGVEFFEGVGRLEERPPTSRDPPHHGLPHNILGFLTPRLLRSFTIAAICGMNRGNQCPYPPFLFPLLPRYGHRLWLPKPYLCWPHRSTLFKQPSRCVMTLHTHSFPPTGLHVARFDHRQRSTQT